MEYFASDPRVLMSIGRHYKSGNPIPAEALEKFCAAKRIFSGVDVQSQLFYSILDQKYHGKHPLEGSTTEILSRVRNLPVTNDFLWCPLILKAAIHYFCFFMFGKIWVSLVGAGVEGGEIRFGRL